MYKHILVATDGSELSMKAVREGVALARGMKARLRFVTCSAPFNVVTMLEPLILARQDEYEAAARRTARERLDAAVAVAREAGVAAETEHSFADQPYQGILQAARDGDCDVIVMASHGRNTLDRLLLGSQTLKVLAHTKIPVLVCR